MLPQRILKTITRYNMLPPGCRVAVAVSGGADSVCLLLALVELAPELGLALSVAHFNHQLRGQASDDDEKFVERLAARFALPFHRAQCDPLSPGGKLHHNLEQAARIARYDFFRGLVETNLAGRIAVGHTRDDQAETVLFRVLRGSGSTGIAGIHPVGPSGVIRPLLDVTRAEVEKFLGSRGVSWREDESNRDDKFARNRIRYSLLPQLQQNWNPQLTSALAQLADLAFEEEQWWRREMDAAIEQLCRARVCRPYGGGLEVVAKAVVDLPKAVARRLARALLARVKGDLRGLEFGHVEGLLALAAEVGGERSLELPGVWITRSCGMLWLRRADLNTFTPVTTPLTQTGTYLAPDGSRVCLRVCLDDGREDSNGPPPYAEANGATLKSAAVQLTPVDIFGCGSAEAALSGSMHRMPLEVAKEPVKGETARNVGGGNALTLRGWRAGDRYRPRGHTTDQKVKEMFQRAQVPSWRRPFWPIVTYGDVIVWAKQFGPAAEFSAQRLWDVPVRDSVRVLRIWGSEDNADDGSWEPAGSQEVQDR